MTHPGSPNPMHNGRTLRELIDALRREMLLQFDHIRRESDQRHIETREKQAEILARLVTLESWRLDFTEKVAAQQTAFQQHYEEQQSQRDRASLSVWQGIVISVILLILSTLINYLVNALH